MKTKKTRNESGSRVEILGVRNCLGMLVGAGVMSVLFGCTFAKVANAISYTITYKENVASNMPENELSGLTGAGASTTTLSPTLPVWAGHRFLGWCDQATVKDGDTDTCTTGHDYQPGGALALDATGNNNVKLYAMWEPEITIATAANMQDVTSCPASLITDHVYTIKDSRDNQDYHVAKLADGKCWMLDNLALDLTDSTVLSSLTADNTNIDIINDPGALAALKGTSVRNPNNDASGKYATAGVANWTSSTDYSYSAPLVNLTNKDVVPTDSTSTTGSYRVGGYYNYCAASAGSYCYGNDASQGTSNGNATSDICPKGWRMPTGNTSGEYSALANSIYGSTGSTSDSTAYLNYRSALHLPLSGDFLRGSANNQDTEGRWWSSTRYNDNGMYRLGANTSNIYLSNGGTRILGHSIRCMLAD